MPTGSGRPSGVAENTCAMHCPSRRVTRWTCTSISRSVVLKEDLRCCGWTRVISTAMHACGCSPSVARSRTRSMRQGLAPAHPDQPRHFDLPPLLPATPACTHSLSRRADGGDKAGRRGRRTRKAHPYARARSPTCCRHGAERLLAAWYARSTPSPVRTNPRPSIPRPRDTGRVFPCRTAFAR